MNRIAGTSQLATDGAAFFTSSKTSPGAAKTFINRPASEVADIGGAAGGGSGIGEMDSTLVKSHPLLRQNPANVTRNVSNFLSVKIVRLEAIPSCAGWASR
jgi:hypothetical protein